MIVRDRGKSYGLCAVSVASPAGAREFTKHLGMTIVIGPNKLTWFYVSRANALDAARRTQDSAHGAGAQHRIDTGVVVVNITPGERITCTELNLMNSAAGADFHIETPRRGRSGWSGFSVQVTPASEKAANTFADEKPTAVPAGVLLAGAAGGRRAP